ncbi:MAG: Do family serine endopeptidase [Terracidiphilus sp.]
MPFPVQTRTRRLPYILIAAVVVILIIGGLLRTGVLRVGGVGAPAQHVTVQVAKNNSPVSLGNFAGGFSSVLDPDLPKVVNISSTKVVQQQSMPNFFSEPFFRQFFGNQPGSRQPRTQREYSLGSGVVINSNGYILTNNHVVAGASDVEVFTQNRRKYRAKIIGTDQRTDIAVLKIEASGLPAFTLGDSSQLKVGDIVFAIGDPFGIGLTATMGIVSATGRALGGSIEHYENFIQTDAAINPGNSGGAMIDLHGNLVGINTAIISGGGGGNEGIGFAIPINMARQVMDQIVAHGNVVRGYLGVTIQNVDPDMAKAFGLSQGGGALVANVSPGGPADKAGVQRGDVILALDDKEVTDSSELSLRISEMAPGNVAHLKVFRSGQTQQIGVTLGTLPQNGRSGAPAPGSGAGTALPGVTVQNLTGALAQQLRLPPGTKGVVVISVDRGSPADVADVKRGDVILQVDHIPVQSVQDYNKALAGKADQPVLLLISRGGQTSYIVIEPQG